MTPRIPFNLTPDIQSTIPVLVLDTTGPVARLRVEAWPRERALAFHGLAGNEKPRPRPLPGRERARTGRQSARIDRL